MSRRLILPALAAGLCAAAAGVVACGGGDDAPAKLKVAAAFYPLREAAEVVGGDRVSVVDLTPVGGQPHRLQPGPDALATIKRAKVILTLGTEFQPAVAKAVRGAPASAVRLDLFPDQQQLAAPQLVKGTRGPVDGGAAGASDDSDPHAWVDPARFATMVDQIKTALVKADPAGKVGYEERAIAYANELGSLDTEFQSGLASCKTDAILATHPSMGYLAEHYGLTQTLVAGVSLGSQPDPASLAAVKAFAAKRGATTLFFNAPVPDALAATIKAKTGLDTAVINPVEGLTQDQLDGEDDYISIMRENLRALQQGLGCEPETAAP